MTKKKYTFIDLFAGCGGLSEGFLQTGKFEGLAHIEWEMPMVETLRHNLVKRWGYNEIDAERQVSILMGSDSGARKDWINENVKFTLEDDFYGENKGRSVDL